MPGRYRRARIGEKVVVRSVSVPFTFWPEAYVERGSLVTSDPWSCLQSYVHQQVQNNTKKNLAITFLEQSQDFHHAAKSAPRLGSKPLLHYYSFLNLVKAFLTVRSNLDLKRSMHGIKEVDENIRKYLTITSQLVKINDSGTGRTQIYREFMKECSFSVPVKPTPTKVVDLLEQIVGIHRITSHTLKKSKQFFFVKEISFEYDPNTKEAWIAFYIDRRQITTDTAASDIRKHMTSFEEVESPRRDCRRYESTSMKYRKSPIQVLRGLVLSTWEDIWSELHPGEYKFWISSINKEKRRAQLASGYQAMFYFGSISRYRPDDFYKLVEGKHGWMIQEFINTQPLQFIYFLGSSIVEAEMVVPVLV